jgi:hypothetical protein
MPLSLDKKPSQRQKVDARDTYRYTTPDISPAARPTDPYVDPGRPRQQTGLSELLNALGDFGGAYERQQYQKEREAIAQGEDDYNLGQEPPEGSHEARIRKYNELRGRGKAAEFYRDAMDLYMRNQTASPEELAGMMTKLVSKYIGEVGQNNPDFMRGFAPRAQEILHGIDAQHSGVKMKEYHAEVLAQGQAIISDEIARVGLDNPQAIRQAITQLQINAKALGLTRTQVSEMVFDYLASQAILEGDQRWTAPLLEPDESGQSIAHVVGAEKVAGLIHRTDSIRQTKENLAKVQKHEAEKEAQNLIENTLLREMYALDPKDAKGYTVLKQKIDSYTDPTLNKEGITLDSSRYTAIRNLMEARLGGKNGFAETPNMAKAGELFMRLKTGKAGPEDIDKAKADITFEQAQQGMGIWLQHQDRLATKEGKMAEARVKLGAKHAVEKFVGKPSPLLGRFMAPQLGQLKVKVEEWYEEYWDQWYESHEPGENPTSADVAAAHEYVKKQKAESEFKDTQPSDESTAITPDMLKGYLGGPSSRSPASQAADEAKQTKGGGIKDKFQQLRQREKQSSLPREHVRELVKTQLASLGFDHIDEDLIMAMIGQESARDPNAVSPKGAGGLMQLMPGTAKEVGVNNVFDPVENVRGGITYFAKMLDRFNHNIRLALAAYNAGPEAVKKYGGIPPFDETRSYVATILKKYGEQQAKRMMTTG